MDQRIELSRPAPQAQGMLFSPAMLPRQPRIFKSELEEDFLSPREWQMLRTQ